MKNIQSIIIVGLLVLGGFGAVALDSDKENFEAVSIEYEQPLNDKTSRDYTHTVFVEVGTASWCPACPGSNIAWHTIYESGNYNFEYCELVTDKNTVANTRMNGDYNLYWVPTSYWDGGEFVYPGTNTGQFYNNLDASGSRSVPDLVADLDIEWLGNAQVDISFNITNNEAVDYPGHLRVYVVELESTLWNDYSGKPYWHAFLDFAENKAINIPAAGSISDTFTWDGSAAGYPGITVDNIQVILAVFGDEGHTSYSDPPSGNPFIAYYSDECIAVLPTELPNDPPEDPEIAGPSNGVAGTSYDYTFTSTDPMGTIYHTILNGAMETLQPGQHFKHRVHLMRRAIPGLIKEHILLKQKQKTAKGLRAVGQH